MLDWIGILDPFDKVFELGIGIETEQSQFKNEQPFFWTSVWTNVLWKGCAREAAAYKKRK